MNPRSVCAAAVAAVALSGLLAAPTQAACPPQEIAAPAQAMRAMYAALAARDETALTELLVPGFYALEGGVRMDRAHLLGLLQAAQARGQVYQWSVNQPDVRMSCDVAWIAYVNKGSVTDAAGTVRPVTWLESAGLGYQDGRWRVLFLNATPTPRPAPAPVR